MKSFVMPALAALALCSVTVVARADDAAIRKNLAERMPNFPKVDEIRKTTIPGVYELRVGTDILYTDETGNYLIQGEFFDTKNRVNITQARIDQLSAIDFSKLPMNDAIAIKQGSGTRKMAVFVDPNCGYC